MKKKFSRCVNGTLKRILAMALCLCLLAGLAPGAWAAGNTDTNTFDISDGDITIEKGTGAGDFIKVTYGAQPTTEDDIPAGTNITLIGTSTTNKVTVDGVTANITINDINIRSTACAFELKGDADVTLTLKGENTLESGTVYAGLQAPEGTTLTISSDANGILNATGGDYGAGIGGGDGGSGGAISISGGTVTATGGHGAAGIGGGYGGYGGTIKITGGTVTATGGGHGAGIGGGYNGNRGTLKITGGSVQRNGNAAFEALAKTSDNSTPAYCVTLTLEGAGGNTGITAESGLNDYGIKDVFTDSSGKVYFWLPADATASPVSLTAGGKTYKNDAVTVAASNDNAFTLKPEVSGGNPRPPAPVDTRPPAPEKTPTIDIGGVTLPIEISKDGAVTTSPEKDQINKIIEGTAGGIISFDFSGVEGITSLAFELDPEWFNNSGKSASFSFNGYSLTVSDGMFYELYELTKGKVRFGVKISSVDVSISQDGKEIDWYNFEHPMIVSMPYTADSDISLHQLVMTDSRGNIIPRSWYRDGKVFAKVYETGVYDVFEADSLSFSDTQGKWMAQAADYLSSRGVIAGVGKGMFAPDRDVTRGEFATMLMRLMDIEMQGAWMVQPFDDAEEGAYYYDALLKAKALGFVEGVGDNRFNPDAKITRQDMFVMLYRAMAAANILPDEMTEQWTEYSDWDEVSGYAWDALQELSKLGLVEGVGSNMINPLDSSKRSEAAQIMYNLLRYDAVF